MKKILILFLSILLCGCYMAQIPTGYYNGTETLSGAALKTKLKQIITNGHLDRGYAALYSGYQTTDKDLFFENDGTVLDMYSENPTGTDPYTFSFSQTCGNYSGEGDCFNREHIIPQSLFGEQSPMRNDIHSVRPTDGKVNGLRSNYPYGLVNGGTITMNGSKLGSSASSGYSGTVFEPINTFKGDIARMIFYFVTRYESQMAGFTSGGFLAQNTFPSLQPWAIQQYMAWAAQDPVSPEEISRNNASYIYQGNRNPYIDHPEYVNLVWGNQTNTGDIIPPSAPLNLVVGTVTASSAALTWTASTDNIGVVGYEIYDSNNTLLGNSTGNSLVLNGLLPSTTYSVYVTAKDAAGNNSIASNSVNFTTLAGVVVSTNCGTESFETIPANASGYTTQVWTNNGITWTATDARTDQTITTRAITIRNGNLTSSSISGGIGSLTVKTQLKFSGSAGSFDVNVNGVKVGVVDYNGDGTVKTNSLSGINVTGNFTLSFTNNSTSTNRVSFDDLSWTCNSGLGTKEVYGTKKQISVAPNPAYESMQITAENKLLYAHIMDMSRRTIYKVNFTGTKNTEIINLKSLSSGTYQVFTNNGRVVFIKK